MGAGDSPKAAQASAFRILFASAWRFRRRVVAAVVLLVMAKIAAVTVPIALKRIVDGLGSPGRAMALPVALLLAYALLRFANTLFSELRDVVFSRVTQQTVADFTVRVFNHLHDLSPRFHASRRTGALTRDVERGTRGIGFLMSVALFTIAPTLVEIGIIVALISLGYSLWFTAAILATFLLYTGFSVVFTQRRTVHQRALNELDSSASSRLVDSLLNYETVKYFTNERFEEGRFRDIMQRWVAVGLRNQRALSALHVGQSGIIAVGVAAVMLLAGFYVVRGAMTVGDLVLINAYVIQVCLPLNTLGFVFRETKDALVNSERLFSLLRQAPEVVETPNLPALTVTHGEVRFERVRFGYDPGRTVLHDVDLQIPAGATVAVVGGSGSGKSTLARLLFRFYDPQQGRITVDGQDLRGVTQESLRRAIGIVPQDTALFNDTIAYNIAYGDTNATRERIVEAARAAHVHDFIASLPDGYDTLVGERGLKLSGGEKQRISIARAILKNPPILVFDEATSALDSRSEGAIQAELARLAKTRTTLVIAHRLSTIVDADEILVMEQGRIAERGTHAALLAQQGAYAQLWKLQRQRRELEQVEHDLSMHSVNLMTLLAGALEEARAELDARRVKLFSFLASDVRVTGDPEQLREAFSILLRHAAAHAAQDGRVELTLERVASRARLGLRFSGTTSDVPVRYSEALALIEAHGGELHRESGQRDTAFRVELPLRPLAAGASLAARGSRELVAQPAPSLAGTRVLIVDPQEEARRLLDAVLSRYGGRCAVCADGEAALARLQQTPRAQWPQVLLCEIALPGMDGYAFLRAIREIEQRRQTAPEERVFAIALTGFARAEDRLRSLFAGFQLHLTKPVDTVELLMVVASAHRIGMHE